MRAPRAAPSKTSPANRLVGAERTVPPGRIAGYYLAKANPLQTDRGWDSPRNHRRDRSAGQVAARKAALRMSAGPVRFAGEHTALDAPGLEGAVRSGERAAEEIITGEQT